MDRKEKKPVLFVELLSQEQGDQLKARAAAAGCTSVAAYVREVLFPKKASGL